jgi:hypothetical protein
MSPDPTQRVEQEPAHDVLAAEAFAVPTADPDLRHRRVELPEDPSGIAEPHDILAAEEFAMPAAGPAGRGHAGSVSAAKRRMALAAAAGGLVALLRLRRRR